MGIQRKLKELGYRMTLAQWLDWKFFWM